MKVHILTLGWDSERSIYGCMKLGADKVYLVVPGKTKTGSIEEWWNNKTKSVGEKIIKGFSKYFEFKRLEVVYEDYFDCFRGILKTIKEEQARGNLVYLNISSGSHILTSAAIFAASLTRAKAYYVIPEKYDEVFKKEERFISYGGREVVDVPLLPISYLLKVELKLLKIIAASNSISITELVEKARPFFKSTNRSKINYYLKKLADIGFLKTKFQSGKIFAEITDSGKMVVSAFEGTETNGDESL